MTRYYIAPVSAFRALRAVEYRAVQPNSNGVAFGWVRWTDSSARAAFEARVGVTPLGTAAHHVPAQAALDRAAQAAQGAHGAPSQGSTATLSLPPASGNPTVAELAELHGLEVRFQ